MATIVIEPFRSFRDLICTIPGIGGFTADVVVAEIGADDQIPHRATSRVMGRHHPGQQRIRRQGSSRAAPDRAIPTYEAPLAPRRCRSPIPATPYLPGRQISPPSPPVVARSKPTSPFNARSSSRSGRHPAGDYFTRLNPHKARNNAVRQLEAMGYHVTLDHAS